VALFQEQRFNTGANMTNELSKTVSTCAIWLATACIFVFGLFRMTGTTDFFLFATLFIAVAALGATVAVWYPGMKGDLSETSSGQQTSAGNALQPTLPAMGGSKEHGITRHPGG
jgi:hypothetical protein